VTGSRLPNGTIPGKFNLASAIDDPARNARDQHHAAQTPSPKQQNISAQPENSATTACIAHDAG